MPLAWTALLILLGLMAPGAGAASGESFPARHVRIVTSQAGGLNDLTARVLAQPLSSALGKPVIVDNRGIVAIDIVAKASPDGHTVLCFASNLNIPESPTSYDTGVTPAVTPGCQVGGQQR